MNGMLKFAQTGTFGDRDYVSDAIDRVETTLMLNSLREVLWGGERGQGLVYAVAELTKSTASLAETVLKISTDINGETGIRATIRSQHESNTARIDNLQKASEEFKNDITKAKQAVNKILVALALIGIGTCIIVGRVGYNVWMGLPAK